MSAALSTQPDRENSTLSNGTHPDISLGTLTSGFSTPARIIRVPSSSSHTTAPSTALIATPSPPPISTTFTRRKTEDGAALAQRLATLSHVNEEAQEEGGGDLLNTPGADNKRWGDGPETPVATRPKRTRASVGAAMGGTKGSALTLRDQEKVSHLQRCIALFIICNTDNTCWCSISTTSKRKISISSYECTFLRSGWRCSRQTRQRLH